MKKKNPYPADGVIDQVRRIAAAPAPELTVDEINILEALMPAPFPGESPESYRALRNEIARGVAASREDLVR